MLLFISIFFVLLPKIIRDTKPMDSTVLLIIDPQNDFCNRQGTLYVPGAETDISRLAAFIRRHGGRIDGIVLTADDHMPNDISHPSFWKNEQGSNPAPFSAIRLQDILSGKYTTTASADAIIATNYIGRLEAEHKTHTIWPQHCVSGTWGAGIDDTLLGTIIGWTHGTNKHYQIVRKGWYPYTEHFGAFAAEVAYPMVESTLFNAPLARELNNYTQILIAGEAKSHCVNNTIKQMIAKAPELVAKLYILEDAMSPVTGFEQLSDETFAKACELGARITDTTTFWAN